MNNTALVTGGSRGIGLGIARCLGAEGCNLAICGIRKEQEVKHVIDELRSMDIDVIYCRADVSDSEDRKRLIKELREHFDHLTILVNNAGVAPLQLTDILNTTEESYDRVMNINLKGTYFLTQMVARWMLKQKEENPEADYCIINIASISSIVASINRGEYCISKAGMSMSTKLWATRLGGAGIRVFEIRPGLIVTDMTARAKERYDKLIAEGITLQDRWGFPEDVGKAAAMLVRGDLPYSNGEVIMVDGGLTMRRL